MGGSLSSSLVYIVPGEPGLYSEILCQKQNKNYINHINRVNEVSLTSEFFYAGLVFLINFFGFFCFVLSHNQS